MPHGPPMRRGGGYMAYTSEIQDSVLQVARRAFKGNWGSFRVPLHPTFDMPSGRTGGFFMHGSTYSDTGSAGCINCGGGILGNSDTRTLLDLLKSSNDGKICVEVTN